MPADDLLHLEQSILAHALEATYLRCMTDYFNTNFADAASMGKYTSRLLKLTNTLLNFFMEVPQSQKAPMCESIPRFDLLLEFVTQMLNSFSAEQIAIRALELVKVDDRRLDDTIVTRFENKFLNEASKTRQSNNN